MIRAWLALALLLVAVPVSAQVKQVGGFGGGGGGAVNSGAATNITGYLKGDGATISGQAVPIPVADGGTATTSVTNNQLLRMSATGGTATVTGSLLSDNGTNVTLASGTLLLPAGTSAAASVGSSVTNGIYFEGTGVHLNSGNSLATFSARSDGVSAVVRSDGFLGFVDTTNARTGTIDARFSRGGAGRIQVLAASGGGQLSPSATASSTNLAGSLFTFGVDFAGLGTPDAGTFLYCRDCTIANPCAAGGTGALAKRLASTWVCN